MEKLKSLGFNSNHFKLLTVAVIVFGSLIFIKSGLSVGALFAQADDEKPTLTYEQAREQVLAERGTTDSSEALESEAAAQLALLDLGNIDGQVLGDAIGIGEIPDADELMLPEISSEISFNITSLDDAAAQAQYQVATQTIEADANVVGLLSELNSSDQETLDHAVSGWQWVIGAMSATPVPASLEKFHKTKLIYYSVMMNIGKVYAGQKTESDLPLLTKAMLSYGQKVETLRAQINADYNLNL